MSRFGRGSDEHASYSKQSTTNLVSSPKAGYRPRPPAGGNLKESPMCPHMIERLVVTKRGLSDIGENKNGHMIYYGVMMDDLTAFQRDILYVIVGMEDDPYPHGLSIKNELELHYSEEVNHGRLYPNLDQLVEMGLVEKGQLDKRTNSYTLTQRGHREIDARREWENQYVDIEA